MEDKIRVLVIEPGKNPEEREIPNTLKALQKIVGGYIETVALHRSVKDGELERIDIVCNEEGKLLGLPKNRIIKRLNDIICGTFLIVATGEEDFISLTDEQVETWTEVFRIE